MAKVADGVARYFEKIPVKKLDLTHHAIGEDDREKIEKGETPALPCGCVGSWWAIKVNKGKKLTLNRTLWINGAKKLSNDFGFNSTDGFTNWLNNHKELWGNEYASKLFLTGLAYCQAPENNLPYPKEIAKQFKTFASNLRKDEK